MRILTVVTASSLLFGCASAVGGKTWSASVVMGDSQWSTGPPTMPTEKLFREVEPGVYEEVEVVRARTDEEKVVLSQQLKGGHVSSVFVGMVKGLTDAVLTVFGRATGVGK